MIKKGDWVVLAGERSYVVQVGDKPFSCQYGEIDLPKLKRRKYGGTVTSHLGKEFRVLEPRLPDMMRKIKRMPQIVGLKDAGAIASYCGLNKGDRVVEAGTGSAALTIFLAGVVNKVYSYEVREDFFKVAKKNLELCGIKNVMLKNKDVTAGILERDVDAVILDMGSPEKAIDAAIKALKPGGFLVVYSPVLEQVERVRNAMGGFSFVKTIELIERTWEIGDNRTRPKTRMLGHTGFLTFGRRN